MSTEKHDAKVEHAKMTGHSVSDSHKSDSLKESEQIPEPTHPIVEPPPLVPPKPSHPIVEPVPEPKPTPPEPVATPKLDAIRRILQSEMPPQRLGKVLAQIKSVLGEM